MRLLGVPKDSIRENDGAVRCPWYYRHKSGDRTKSCSIYRNMTRIHCFVCDYNYGIPQFVAAWRRLSDKEGYHQYMRMAEARTALNTVTKLSKQTEHALAIPPTRHLTPCELEMISSRRHIDVEALQWAAQEGVLCWANVCTAPSWLLADSAGLAAEARTLTGALYPAFRGLSERKAHTIRGSHKAWPVGTALLHKRPTITTIIMVEGGPDLLAAFHFLRRFGVMNVLPVALLGAKAGQHGIAPEALKLFQGRHVRVFPHNDPAGSDSFINWTTQLQRAGCTVSRASFAGITLPDGTPAKDLNDLTSRLPGSHEPYHFLFK
jgi:hypothetical protein